MEFDNGTLQLDVFLSVTLGIVVLFVGKRINDAVSFQGIQHFGAGHRWVDIHPADRAIVFSWGNFGGNT